MEAYNTKAKAEDKRRLLMERRAKLRELLDNEMKQLEVHVLVLLWIYGIYLLGWFVVKKIAANNIYTKINK